MDEFEEELKRIIKNQIDSNVMLITAKVKEVDEKNYNITIESNLLKKSTIPIRALNITNNKGVIPIPKVNSSVALYVQKHKKMEYVRILSYSEIDKVLINTDKVSIEVNNDDVHINAEKVYLNADNENEPLLIGEKTTTLLNKIMDWMLNHTHQVLTQGSPTLPVSTSPESVDMLAEINIEKANVDNIKSTKNFTDGEEV